MHEHDIREPLGELFDEIRPEIVVHLAAQADVGTSVEQPLFDAEVNVLGTRERARGGARHTARRSSSARPAARSTASASARHARTTSGGRSRRTGRRSWPAEEYLATWNRLHGTRHVALRFANVYGPRQLPKLEGGVVAIFIDRLRAGERVTIFGDGEQTARLRLRRRRRRGGPRRDRARRRRLQRRHRRGDLRERALRRPAAGSPGSTPRPSYAPARPGDALRSVLDVSHAERELGWRPQTSLAQGLRETWAACRPAATFVAIRAAFWLGAAATLDLGARARAAA